MPFEKVNPKVDFPALERDVLKLWDREDTFNKLRAQNAGKPKWSFLDGPITANNPMGVHHAWGRTYKDTFQRYFAMTGHELRYQNGFDCQGLWVEIEVEREHGFSTKEEIESFGLDKFTDECKARVHKYSAIQAEQSKRLGFWMDWDNSYYTMAEENNYTIWTFLKKCHDLGYLYKGTDVMPWSGRAGSAYSHMEIAEGRKLVTHTSVFVRFPIRGKENEYLLVWTTTPWTLPGNTAAAISGDLEYVKLRSKKDGALYYFAKENLNHQRLAKEFKEGFGNKPWPKDVPKLKTLHQIFHEVGGYDIEGTINGGEMVGWTYDGPFDELPAQQHQGGYAQPLDLLPTDQRDWPCGKDAHVVFDPGKDNKGSSYVVAGEGTGIVHSAPGCGDVDHTWGIHFRLPAIAPLDDQGRFVEGFGKFTGMRAADESTAEAVIDDLREKGFLVAAEKYPHIYPHCWRTGDPLVFRLVDEWYISMDWREEIKEITKQVNWLPASMRGLDRELDWLTSMRDWMISKKRFWGLALPIWECKSCGHYDVIGSREELQERAVEGWEEFEGHTPHRPYVDRIKIKCTECGELANRVPDVGNPWLDAGIVAYSTTKYNSDRNYWDQWIPADLITECFPGQFRNWFYAILSMSTMMEMGKEKKRPPFKNLLGHALVVDENRQVMHKSDGTAIWFEEAAEQIGVDTMRWMYCAQPPTTDLPFGLRHPEEEVTIKGDDGMTITHTVDGARICRVTSKPADETRRQVLMTLWNSYAFFSNYARIDGFDPTAPQVPLDQRQDIDRWILSDLQLLVGEVRDNFEAYSLSPVCVAIKKFLDDLSTWYIRRNRRRFWRGVSEGDTDKLAAYQTLYEVLATLGKLAAPIIPFVSEHIYQHLVAKQLAEAPQSVHLCAYPTKDASRVDDGLSRRMAALLHLVGLGRSARTASKLKVRQPLAQIIVASEDENVRGAVEQFQAHILEELNVKKATTQASVADQCSVSLELNRKTAGPKYGKQLGAIAKALGQADAAEIADQVGKGMVVTLQVEGQPVTLDPPDINVTKDYGQDWAGAEEGGVVVLLDKRLTEELRQEGLARDVVRFVQVARKEAGLELEDRITLSLQTEGEQLQEAIEVCKDYIAAETLATTIESTPIPNAGGTSEVKVARAALRIEIVKA